MVNILDQITSEINIDFLKRLLFLKYKRHSPLR